MIKIKFNKSLELHVSTIHLLLNNNFSLMIKIHSYHSFVINPNNKLKIDLSFSFSKDDEPKNGD